MAKQWRVATHDPARIAALERAAGLPTVVAQLLIARGIDNPTTARDFLEPKLTGLRDPQLLPGVERACDVLLEALQQRKPIVIYGDYDADGMTAAAILLRCLRLLRADVRFYVPHRMEEGYGLNAGAIRTLADEGARTIVTVDCGIASLAEADLARELGIDLVVTDHHKLAERLPHAAAIVHPGLPGEDYPFTGLCGAAVAFKLAWALCQRVTDAQHGGQGGRVSEPMRRMLMQAVGLAAIGSVADVVPLIDENRILVRHGLNALRHSPVPGVVELERVAQLGKKPDLSGEDLGFAMAPRLNAAGRLGQAELGVELLATDDPRRAAELADYVDELNEQRKSVERSVLLAARKQAKDRFDPAHDPALVLADRGWHAGVIGIVAGKLAEQYHKPVVVVSLDKLGSKPGTGSGRSIPGFDLHRAFAAAGEHLASHGGHAAAAGLRIDEANLDAFRIDFCAHTAQQLGPDGQAGELRIDAETSLASLTHQTVTQIERLAPFGHGNERPMLCASDVRLAGPPRRMGGAGRHLSVDLEQHGVKLRAVAFGAGDWENELRAATGPLEIAFQPLINTFRGYRTVEMRLADWKPGQ
ncbi:single-stranded-DNA-specific exonuclease RecJ [Botrimarina hoheduenensis]|uniref:Single-stranded-DNA-specific exonuclease RecJ n=1 Tax=Botrimarina hoheduenensis TaxID=2528000 RepID=A0A5C5VY85_9BACT|nr:single-stranded-DNA-specific exonuclease RecJ [Botrimarina hoheduenensis]TWT42701.1 Single-stranded-DNA-specific exonuclease RecJ [Botrimarina hoheduenensis]